MSHINLAHSYPSLEGYLAGMFALEVLDLLQNQDSVTGEDFLEAVYDRELFSFLGLRLGAFGDTRCNRFRFGVCTQSASKLLYPVDTDNL